MREPEEVGTGLVIENMDEGANRTTRYALARLGDVCDIAIGRTPARDTPSFWNGDRTWISISDLKKTVIESSAEQITPLAIEECRCPVVRAGTLLFSFKLTIGKMAFAGKDLYTNEAIAALTPKDPNQLCKYFLRLALLQIDASTGSSHAVKGRTLNRAGLERLQIPLPPLPEQERIAARLTEQLAAVARARAAAEARLAAAEALPGAMLREAFGESSPFSAAPIVPTVPTRPGWRWRLLTQLATLATGHTPSRRHPEYWGGSIPWIQLPDIRAIDGTVATSTSEQTNPIGIANSAAVLLPPKTVCLSRTASVGFVTIMGREMATSQDFVNWVCGPDLDPEFLMYLFLASRKQIRDLGSGATHQTIYFPTVKQFAVCVPDIEEQRRLVQQLSRTRAAASAIVAPCRAELADIDALPAALLREAFHGAN